MLRYDILAKASEYIGLKEIPDNNIIFNTHYYGREVNSPSYAWCCAFVWDIFRMCNASKYFYGGNKMNGCTTLLNFYKNNYPHWVHTDINRMKSGDLVFYQFDADYYADHIGIFDSKISDTRFYAVEGNTTSGVIGDQANGYGVYRRNRPMSCVMAFVSIEFEDDDTKAVEKTHKVKKGETLGYIANMYGSTVPAILSANPSITNANLIYVNQIIVIPVHEDEAPKTYTVVKGDTLSGIGKKCGVAWREIATLNGISFPYIIRPNQVLRLR